MMPMTIKQGHYAGQVLELEGDMKTVLGFDQLTDVLNTGVGLQAIHAQRYEQTDAPFYYGKIDRLGYLLSHADLFGE